MLETNRAHSPKRRIAVSRATRASLALRALDVVQWAGNIARTADLVLRRHDTSSGEEQCCGRRRAQLEVERAVRANGDAGRDRGACDVLRSAGIEFLGKSSGCVSQALYQLGCCWTAEAIRTLQKSMLLTPLLPSAGPTGGEGDA